MAQSSGSARFAQKAIECQLVLRNIVRQKFQRYHAPELGVFGLVHHAHAAATKPFYYAILGDNLPDEGLRVCHSVHILDSAHRQVNAGTGVVSDLRSVLAISWLRMPAAKSRDAREVAWC